MSMAEEIFGAADREGLGIADYIKRYYDEQSLGELEQSLESQLSSLRSTISDFMSEVQISDIDTNLLLAGSEKLDSMQERIKETIRAKQIELESIEGDLDSCAGDMTEGLSDM